MGISNRFGYQLKRLQQALRVAMDGELQKIGLTSVQYVALSALEELPGASNAILARHCFVTPQTMNEIILGLQKLALINRQAQRGRVIELALSASGQAKLIQAHELVAVAEKQMLHDLNETEQDLFVKWLEQSSQSLERSFQQEGKYEV